MKAKKTIIGILTAVASLCTFLCTSCATTKQAADETIIYESPSLSAKKIGWLKEGESAIVLEMGEPVLVDGIESIWVKVCMNDGTEGWGIAEKPKEGPSITVSADHYFVIERKGSKVTATDYGELLTGNEWREQGDPSVALAAFFESYFSQDGAWKNFFVHYSSQDSLLDEGVALGYEAWERFYGKADFVRITINPDYFKYNGDGSAFYTVKIAASYQGESIGTEDQVTMCHDDFGNWYVVKLPM